MFESIIALFIKRYVARYIDINADQLSAQLLYKQEIIIENLTLNKTTLNEDIQTKFKLPIEIDSVHIDRIQCSFVLSSLFFRSSSAAFIIKIEGVHAVIKSAEINEDESSLKTSADNHAIKKRHQLNLAEQQLEKELECFGEVKSSRWNVQRLLMSFSEKLHIEIVNIHITYESSTSYTMGFTCDNIQISNESTDETMSRQVIRIINPGLYIDLRHPSTHSYILPPTSSMEIYLIHNHFLVSQKEYRYEFQCSLNDLNIKYNIEQIGILADIIRTVQKASLHRMLISDPNRPRSKISKQSAKAWWRYVTLAVLRTQVDSTNLIPQFWFDRPFLIHRLHQLTTYQRLYRAYLDNKYFNGLNFSSEDELVMNNTELEFDIKYLLIIRRSIFQTRINEQLSQKKETERWYSNYAKWITTKVIDLWGKTPAEDTSVILNENDQKLQEQVNTFIAETLEDEDLSESCQNALIFRFKFGLKSVQIDLLSATNDILFNFYLKNLSVVTEFRLRHRSIHASVCLEDLCMRDLRQTDAFAKIMCSKERSEQVPVFELSLEKKARSKNAKQTVYSISIRSCGLCIVCCPTTLERLHHVYMSAFGSSSQSFSSSLYNWKQIKNYAVYNFISLLEQIMPTSHNNSKKVTSAYLRNRRREKKKFQIYMDIGAPKIIIPLSTQSAFVVDLGSVTLTNDTHGKDDPVTALPNTVFAEQLFPENDDEEFLTPDSSPLANDNPLEEETTYYSINAISPDVEYSSFSLSIRDIQVGYSIDLSQIVEKFSIHFLVQHPLDHLWPLVNISGTIQKIVVHLNPQIIQSLCSSVQPWITFINNFVSKQHYRPIVWPTLTFRLDEVGILLHDGSQALCDVRMQNIDLSFIRSHQLNNLIFTLQTLTIFDCMQQDGKRYEFILKTDRTSNVNDYFIRVNLSIAPETRESSLTIDVNADKLDFVFNPNTICTLVNFLLNINLISWSQTISEAVKKRTNQISCKINSMFRELHVFFINITPMVSSIEVHVHNTSLNILLNPFLTFEMTIAAIRIVDLLNDPQQSTVALAIDHLVSQNPALYLLLTNTMKNDKYNLSMRIDSLSYFHSRNMICTIQKILGYMRQNCHLITTQDSKRENHMAWLFTHITRSTLSIDLNRSKFIFSTDAALQLDQIRIRNSDNQSSEYEIQIDRIDFTNQTQSFSWELLENIAMSFHLQMSNNTSIEINSKLISPLRIFLSQKRIKLLQQILKASDSHDSSSLSKFAFYIQPSQMIIIFQADRNDELITIGEAILNQCQMSYELDYPAKKKIAVKFNSLQMKDRLSNPNESLIDLTCTELIDNQHEQFDIKLGKVDIKFIKSTWTLLSEMIRIIDTKSSANPERKKHPMTIAINIDTISCLFQDHMTMLMRIDLQRFTGQIRTCSKQSTINGELGFISIRDLTTIEQLYNERLYTTGTNAVVFSLTIGEEDSTDLSVRPQFHLRMSSIQYIHTQRFLLRLIDYFNQLQSLIIKPVISKMNRKLGRILINAEIENITLILPEHELKESVLIFQLSSIHFQNQSTTTGSPLTPITIKMKDIDFYSSSHCLMNERSATFIRFSNYGFNRLHPELSSMLRQPFHLNMEIAHHPDKSVNQTSPTYSIRMNLSSLDLLFHLSHYHLIENILTSNLHNLFSSSIVIKDDIYPDFALIIEIDAVGLEIFRFDLDFFPTDHRRSLGHAVLTNLHLSFDQYTNGNQTFHLLCSTIKLIDTRIQNEDMILPLSMSSTSSQLEMHLFRAKLDNQCTITMNSVRLLIVIDWLLELNEFLNLFCQQQTEITTGISIAFSEIKLYLNRFELVLTPITKDPYSNALIYSSTMGITYKKGSRPLECSMTDFTLLTCQIGNINETAVPIIEPTDCSLTIQTSNETLHEQRCELTIPILNIRLSYSDIKMIYSLIHTISQQISQAKTRKPLLTFISSALFSPIQNRPSSLSRFLNIKFLKFPCDEMCLCLIDDCCGVNIPLLNLNLKPFLFQTIENNQLHRTDQCAFDLIISYYNRFQSGFEPLIELCPLQMTWTRSPTSNLLFISSKEILNLNFTKAMYRLSETVRTNWLTSYHNLTKKDSFRRVKPVDPYCFQNFLGMGIKFRTWITNEQRFSPLENMVDDHQTVSFCFPTRSSQSTSNTDQPPRTRARSNSVVASLFQSDRRLLISIDGWETLQPISIDRVGTFFRLAKPSNHHQLYKPILVIINIAMTDSSIRSITIRSSIEIRNQLLTSVDMQFKSLSNTLHHFCLEPNETRSLPIQLCSTLKQIQIRPANFALDYCDDPINWSEIEKSSSLEEKTKNYQSFLRTCSINRKEAVYYVCLQSKQTSLLTYQNQSLSIYQLTVLPPLTICNFLPCTLTFEILSSPGKFEINAYKFHREHALNTLHGLDILFSTNLYHMTKPLHLPAINDLDQMKSTHQRVIFYDHMQRELMVDVTIECLIKHRVKILVSVPYILMNKSGIPLIFKDSNSKVEAAGQSSDDESMLNREPFLFSFENSNRNNTCVMRVGTGLHRQQDGRPQWSPRFSIEHGSTHRQLQVRAPRNSSDWNYSIGIDVRPGNGQLKKINFIFLSARYIICNQCSYDLLIAQRPIKDEDSTCLHVSKHATVAYHWPRTDMEQLLCVRVVDNQRYQLVNWSGGFQIDCVNVFHINMRDENGRCLILRVQIVERHGTYFVIFMDSNQMPAPFRIANRSDVPIQFYQTDVREELIYLRTVLQPYQSIDYAWDEPTLKPMITCSIPDGTKATYDLFKLGSADDLNYQNYIYLAFQATFDSDDLMQLSTTTSDSSFHQLVIEYTDHRLFLAHRQENKRSQLWQLTNNGLLIHVGSSSFPDWNKRKDLLDDIRQSFVLDIEDLTNHVLSNLTTGFNTLTVRRYDSKRTSTQIWHFRDNGYLCMDNTQMCVQVFGELKEKSDVVLGPCIKDDNQLPPATMHIRSHQRYKGSGVLSVRVIADGPTNVLEIDHKKIIDLPVSTAVVSPLSTIYHLDLHFPAGIGISMIGSIGHESEELMYILVNNLHIQYDDTNTERSIEATIDTLIISNQLLTTTKPCFLYTSFSEDAAVQSAIRLQINWQKYNNNFTLLRIIHSLQLDITSITIQLDEILLWKLMDFFDIRISSISSLLFPTTKLNKTSNSDRRMDLNVNEYETERILSLLTSTRASRIYFHKLSLSSLDLNLSVYCIHSKRSLSPHLLTIKRRAPFPLVPFENAQIHLKSYEQTHISNTYDFFLLSIMTHYINVCTRQALKILGTVDFLGNPLGLIHDVTDGITCLSDERGVSGLAKLVAHGVADSTSKVTGSLSHGLGRLVSDNDRRQITTTDHPRSSTIGHVIRRGTAGIAAGFYGGLTSMVKQPYKGVVEEGVPGLMKGFAKGIVGTVSKPMVGILDFTNEMATVIKESARSSNTIVNNRIRLTRCPCNTLGLLQPYSSFDAQGHYLLYKMNKGNLTERYISRLTLSTTPINSTDKRVMATNNPQNTDAMITTQRVILYRTDDDPDVSQFEILHTYDFNTSLTILPIEDNDGSAYIQILLHAKPTLHPCDSLDQATLFSREVQRAQDLFQEEKLIYIPSDDENDDIDE